MLATHTYLRVLVSVLFVRLFSVIVSYYVVVCISLFRSWVNGETCSDMFSILNQLERKIIVKYYAEEYNDKQISDYLGLHINTVNQKRRQAVHKLAEHLDIDLESIKRNRNSGRSAV